MYTTLSQQCSIPAPKISFQNQRAEIGKMEKTRRRERKSAMSTTTTTMAKDMEIEVASSSIDGALIFHIVSDVLAFLLYMHQQIPS